MLPFPTWLQPPVPPVGLMGNFRLILENLRASAAIRASATWVMAPRALLLSAYISSVMRRFESLHTRFHAGQFTARPARPVSARPRADVAKPDTPKPGAPKRRAPRQFAWLIEFLPHHAASYAGQLRHLLTHDPEMMALMAATPQAGRILRPLCRMLGMEPAPDLPPSLFPPRAATPPVPAATSATPPPPRSRYTNGRPGHFANRDTPPPLRFWKPA